MRYLTGSGLFAADYIAHLDGFTVIPGGWINYNWIQILHQFVDAITGGLYSFVMTCLILVIMNYIPGLSLRVSHEEEEFGIDECEIADFT